MAPINIDENRWPIVIITLSGKETRYDIQEFLGKLEGFCMRDEEFCIVMDLRELNSLSDESRDMLIEGLINADLDELAGTAFVVSSPLMRFYLFTVLWLNKSLYRHKVRYKHKSVFSLSKAYEWSRECLHIHRPGSPRASLIRL
ncbi:MAG: hypothetical protein WD097_04140 [Balneolales bacterium]